MIKVLGMKKKSGSFVKEETGEKIEYDNILLSICTNEVEDYKGFYCKEEKIKRQTCELEGVNSWDEILGSEIEFCYSVFTTKPKIIKVRVIKKAEKAV